MTDLKLLHAYADGELTPAEANDVRQALKSDPRASGEVDAILNLKDVLAKNSLRHTDDEVWKGCLRRLDALDRNRKVEGFVGRYAWALCAVMLGFILTGRIAMRNVQGDSARAADFVGHSVASPTKLQTKLYDSILGQVRSGLDPNGIDVSSAVAGQVHDLPALRFTLFDRQGDLVLTRVGGYLNIQDTAPLSSDPEVGVGISDGENCLIWHRHGETWFLSGARSVDALAEVVSRLAPAR